MSMSYNPYSLEGKTILVTGASSGIGQAIAIECSKLGATLVLTARNESRLQETLSQCEGEGHKVILADLTDEAQMQELVDSCPELDGLALVAGIGNIATIDFASRKKLDRVFNTNFFAPVELFRLLLRQRKLKRECSTVCVDSIDGVFCNEVGHGMYGASKAALHAFVKTAAKELGPRIRVNEVCPGMVETPLIHDALSDEQLALDRTRYPMQRYGEPRDVALAVIYLLSNASAWVTGSSLVIDGGRTI